MRKTQQNSNNNKTSFKGILNLQNQKLPQKKTRSRSIKDRNNTTSNQYTYSRVTQNDKKSLISGAQNERHQINEKNRKSSMNNNEVSNMSRIQDNRSNRIQDNHSNLSRNESSIQKVRQNMRRQSQELKQRERNRSHSRRKRSQNRNKQNSISHPASRFPHPLTKDNPSSNQQLPQGVDQKLLMTQIVNLKNHINSIQRTYSLIGNQLNSYSIEHNINSSSYYQNQSNTSYLNEEQELKQKANDLNNILESFHIKFKQNLNKTNKQLLSKIDQYQSQTNIDKENHQLNTIQKFNEQQQKQQQFSQNSIQSMFNKIQKQFSIGQYAHSNNSLFQKLKNNQKSNFNDLQKRIILTQQRLLK